MLTADELVLTHLGECRFDSPLAARYRDLPFVDRSRVLHQRTLSPQTPEFDGLSFEEAGPRSRLFFDPGQTTAAIVTCGGLSPGLNNVIRSVFLELHHNYGVKRVLGIRNGYMGLNPSEGPPPIELCTEYVEPIHAFGGSVLGSSRGPQDPKVIVDYLLDRKIDLLFCVGGDGTQRGATQIADEVKARKVPIAIVGIPKTIDNDIPFVRTSFGYNTALEKAAEVIRAAHVEAKGAPNGIGLVKLMGRHAGYIAAGAAVASQDANFVLIPEVPFPLDGPGSFLEALEARMNRRDHALVVVAEGAGQMHLEACAGERDASGNLKFGDIGEFLAHRIKDHFRAIGKTINLKYLDPSYLVRSIPANASDRLLCDWMARYAVHAGMAGLTDVMVGYWNDEMILLPIGTSTRRQRRVDLRSDLWLSVQMCTGQPEWIPLPAVHDDEG
jgi:6-phosphofructokinase 1